jgi:ribosomal protein S18 acetylase RimI-like enzyme
MNFNIRSYHPTDMSCLYRICLLTADNGQDASGLFRDPDLPGHLYAAPYAYYEPESCFILETGNRPVGYILGTSDSAAFYAQCEHDWLPMLRRRYPIPEKGDDTVEAKMIHGLHLERTANEIFFDYPAHLHIDILPVGQGHGMGRQLIETFLQHLRRNNIKGVHLGVSSQNPNAIGFYKKIGFHVLGEYPTFLSLGMNLV